MAQAGPLGVHTGGTEVPVPNGFARHRVKATVMVCGILAERYMAPGNSRLKVRGE